MGCVARDAPFGFDWGMLVDKGALFVRVTLDTSCIDARCQPRLLEFKSAVRVVAITALHRAFEHLVVERQVELVLCLAMTTQAELWLALL